MVRRELNPRRLVRAALVLCTLVLLATAMLATPTTAAKKEKLIDLFWTTPDSVALAAVGSIAQLPVATFDHVSENERVVEMAWSQSFGASGYRWLSSTTSRNLLRGGAGGDSVTKAVRDMILKSGQVDSVSAGAVCARLRVRAVLSVRVDQWEQRKIDWAESGKPSTNVRLRAALVDSLGRLLWSASGSEFAEGPYQQAVAQPPGAPDLNRGDTDRKQGGGPPEPSEVLMRLFKRWAPQFPARAQATGDR